MRHGHLIWLVPFVLAAVLTYSVVFSATPMAVTKTLGVPPTQSRALPPTGGLPERSLTLKGKLVREDSFYRLKVTALPGYVVNLRFATQELEAWATSHVGQNVAVSGYWDKTQSSVFLVDSATLS